MASELWTTQERLVTDTADTRKRHFEKKNKRKEAKWKTTMQSTRPDEENRQWAYISEFERGGTVSNNYTKKWPLAECAIKPTHRVNEQDYNTSHGSKVAALPNSART